MAVKLRGCSLSEVVTVLGSQRQHSIFTGGKNYQPVVMMRPRLEYNNNALEDKETNTLLCE